MEIEKIIIKCPKCNKKIELNKIKIVNADYNQLVIDLIGLNEDWYDGNHICEVE